MARSLGIWGQNVGSGRRSSRCAWVQLLKSLTICRLRKLRLGLTHSKFCKTLLHPGSWLRYHASRHIMSAVRAGSITWGSEVMPLGLTSEEPLQI
jgi:hypothetical protein